ncbi:hypothetical protein YC2023_073788 [Brassica napus]
MFKDTKFLRPDREKRWPESMLYDISSTDNRLRAEILAGMKPSNEFQLKFKAMSRFSMSKSSSGMVPRDVVTAEIKKLKIRALTKRCFRRIRDLSQAFKILPRFKSKTPSITTLMPIN